MIKTFTDIQSIYMLGIGGIGMSALARYFHAAGMSVSGYDRMPTVLTDELIKEGIHIHFKDDPTQIPDSPDLVIYTPAIPDDLKELLHLQKQGVPIKKRAQMLGELTQQSKTVAVAGTHGKTTVSSMIAHILYSSDIGCCAFLGGVTKNYDSNFLCSPAGELMVVEADEYDRSFLQLHPTHSVVTSMDADHLDIYSNYSNLKETFQEFISNTKKKGNVLIKEGVDLEYASVEARIYKYSLDKVCDFYASNFRIQDSRYLFDLNTPNGKISSLSLQMPGLINVENAVAASAISLLCGVSEENLRNSLANFRGIRRRFDVRIEEENKVYIDDYAHHPEEIRGLVHSVKEMYPGKSILGIFQPHLFTRTRDFATGFAESLSELDEVVLLPIYPAREQAIEGVDANMILDKINLQKKKLLTKDELLKYDGLYDTDILLTIGAGDIDKLVRPLEQVLQNRKTFSP